MRVRGTDQFSSRSGSICFGVEGGDGVEEDEDSLNSSGSNSVGAESATESLGVLFDGKSECSSAPSPIGLPEV